MLVEDNPMELLKKYSSTSLEEVFLKVCHMQEHLKVDTDNDSNNNDANKQIDSEESTSLIVNHALEEVQATTASLTSKLASKLAPTCQIFEMANGKHDQPFAASQQHSTMGKFEEFFIDHYNKTKSQIKKSVVKTQRNLGKCLSHWRDS